MLTIIQSQSIMQAEKQLELQLFKLYHNEREIDELSEEKAKKERIMEKEVAKKDKIEDEVRDKKKEHGKLIRELGKIDQAIKESVSNDIFVGSGDSVKEYYPTIALRG